MPALLALASAMTFGVADFLGGRAAHRSPLLMVTLLSNVAGGVMAVVLLVIVGGDWTAAAVGWAAVGGVCGLGGLLLLYQGLASGPNRLVSPLSAVIAAVIPVVVGIGTGERPGALAIAGLALVPVAVWLVAGGDIRAVGAERTPVLLALGAGVGFGLFFVALAQVPDGGGAVPLVVARATSVTLLAVAVVTSPTVRGRPTSPLIPLLAGLLDMTANGLFLWASRDGDLAVVGALVSLFPVTTVALARFVLDERLTRSQIAGVGTAVLAAALLS